MSFTWPAALLLLALVPLGLLLDRALERSRRGRLAAAGLAPTGGGQRPSPVARLRRRVSQGLLVAGLVLCTVALARPHGAVGLPQSQGIVVLVFDVSGSMAATDLEPTRMEAAQAAAAAFVKRQPPGVIVGVVAFSDGGIAVQAPTRDQAAVLGAISRLEPQRGTSLGQGILVALRAIDLALNPPPTDYYSNRSPATSATPAPTPVPPGTQAPAVIVLLTDGENNEEPDPLEAARVAAEQGVRIHTVGVGSAAGIDLEVEGFVIHTQLDQALLDDVSGVTGGTAYLAADASDLQAVYDTLGTRVVVTSDEIELTGLFAAASVVLLVIGGLLSLAWLGRLP